MSMQNINSKSAFKIHIQNVHSEMKSSFSTRMIKSNIHYYWQKAF